MLLHAIIDALLGAAALPDIGFYFPPGDPKTAGIASGAMLAKAVGEIKKRGYAVGNVDAVVGEVDHAGQLCVPRLDSLLGTDATRG